MVETEEWRASALKGLMEYPRTHQPSMTGKLCPH